MRGVTTRRPSGNDPTRVTLDDRRNEGSGFSSIQKKPLAES